MIAHAQKRAEKIATATAAAQLHKRKKNKKNGSFEEIHYYLTSLE